MFQSIIHTTHQILRTRDQLRSTRPGRRYAGDISDCAVNIEVEGWFVLHRNVNEVEILRFVDLLVLIRFEHLRLAKSVADCYYERLTTVVILRFDLPKRIIEDQNTRLVLHSVHILFEEGSFVLFGAGKEQFARIIATLHEPGLDSALHCLIDVERAHVFEFRVAYGN